MSLRARLLVLFLVIAVLPLLGLGLFDLVHSRRTLEAHVGDQGARVTDRALQELQRSLAVQASDLSLLAENAETQRILNHRNDPADRVVVDADALAYLAAAWRQFAPSYHGIELRDARGALVLRLGDAGPELDGPSMPRHRDRTTRPIRHLQSGRTLGSIVAYPRLETLLPLEALRTGFGASGYSIVVDRAERTILYHPRATLLRQDWQALALDGLVLDGARLAAPAGRLTYEAADSTRVAAFASLDSPPWTILATTAVDEFAGPFTRMSLINLLLVLVVIASASLAAAYTIRRATRSLETVTAAADAVGRGDLDPVLPPPGPDEVGRLATGFATMVTRIRTMMDELERSRQMAAVGEFAAELSHEIRNPLTSVKLNLQRIDRLRARGRVPVEAEEPLGISLREVARLERVVQGVLALGRPASPQREPCDMRALLEEAVRLVRADAEQRGVALECAFEAPEHVVHGDCGMLSGAVLNLLRNGLEAMPDGGRLRVTTNAGADGRVTIRIADSGAGVPEEVRDRLFHPFFTTRPEGTGLGLALAARAAEAHDGELLLEQSSASGSTFRLDLPLQRA